MTALFSAASFLLKHWKLVLAVVLLLGCFVEGYHLRAKQDALAQAQAEANTLKARLATITLQQALDAKRARQDRATLETLQRITRETPPNTGPCLDRAATGRVQRVK